MSLPDDLPAGVPPDSAAAAWALGAERRKEDSRFTEIVQAMETGLFKSALPYARRRVGSADAEDAVSDALEKAMRTYSLSRGKFKPYFYIVLGSVCKDRLKGRGRKPQTFAESTWWNEKPQAETFSDAAVVEDEDMRDRIAAALEVLKLSDVQRNMLGRLIDMLDGAEADQFAHLTGPQKKRAMANARQQKKRAVDKVLDRAGVTAEERVAARLVRVHRSLDEAKAAAPRLDVPGLWKSAERKVLRLFDIDMRDNSDRRA